MVVVTANYGLNFLFCLLVGRIHAGWEYFKPLLTIHMFWHYWLVSLNHYFKSFTVYLLPFLFAFLWDFGTLVKWCLLNSFFPLLSQLVVLDTDRSIQGKLYMTGSNVEPDDVDIITPSRKLFKGFKTRLYCLWHCYLYGYMILCLCLICWSQRLFHTCWRILSSGFSPAHW